jgi:translation elongation factor EF-4
LGTLGQIAKPRSTPPDLLILPRLPEKVIPRQLFQVSIQAAIGTKIIARESLSAMKKDVTAGLYGGHYERKVSLAWKGKRSRFQKRVNENADCDPCSVGMGR